MDWVILDSIDIEIDRAEVARVVGGRRENGEIPAGRGGERIEAAIELASGMIEPSAVYTITEGRNIAGPPIFNMLESMGLCICTVGGRLEKRAAELSEEGALLEALVLDTAGSTAVEATADYVNRIMDDLAHRRGKRTSLRASPGYGNWDIRDQKEIFRIAPAEKIGVSLGDGMMMKPRKSISFAVHISENPVRLRSGNDCRNCSMENCPYRREI
jgi:hypothetical protein